MAIDFQALLKTVKERFGDDILGHVDFRRQFTLRIRHTANLPGRR